MKVQEFATPRGRGYTLLDDDYKEVIEVKGFVKFLYSTNCSPNTIKSYCDTLKIYYNFCNIMGYNVLEINSNENKSAISILSEFVDWLQFPEYVELGVMVRDRKPKRKLRTVHRYLHSVLSFYQFLAIDGKLQELPVYEDRKRGYTTFLHGITRNTKKISKAVFDFKYDKQTVQPITRDTYNKLFRACNTRRDQILVGMLFECGLRINEALGIHLSPDLDQFQDRVVQIIARENNENNARVKNHAEGEAIVPEYLQEMINDYLIEDIPCYDSDYLFLNLNGYTKGLPMNYSNAYDLFRRLSKKIGENVHPHMLRHGFAQEKLDSGWTLEMVQAYLRHKNPTSTNVYAQYTPEQKREAINQFYYDREKRLNPNVQE